MAGHRLYIHGQQTEKKEEKIFPQTSIHQNIEQSLQGDCSVSHSR